MRCRASSLGMTNPMRNDLTIYDRVADQWWWDEVRWVRTLKNLVPGRLKWFGRHIDWPGKAILDIGCAGGFMAEAMAQHGAIVTGIDPASAAVEATRRPQGMPFTITGQMRYGRAPPKRQATRTMRTVSTTSSHSPPPTRTR